MHAEDVTPNVVVTVSVIVLTLLPELHAETRVVIHALVQSLVTHLVTLINAMDVAVIAPVHATKIVVVRQYPYHVMDVAQHV